MVNLATPNITKHRNLQAYLHVAESYAVHPFNVVIRKDLQHPLSFRIHLTQIDFCTEQQYLPEVGMERGLRTAGIFVHPHFHSPARVQPTSPLADCTRKFARTVSALDGSRRTAFLVQSASANAITTPINGKFHATIALVPLPVLTLAMILLGLYLAVEFPLFCRFCCCFEALAASMSFANRGSNARKRSGSSKSGSSSARK